MPDFRHLAIGHIKRVARVSVLGQSEMKERYGPRAQHLRDLDAALPVRAMNSPRGDDLSGFAGMLKKHIVILRALWLGCAPHRRRIRIAPGENVCNAESREPKNPRAPLAALHRWIIALFIRNRRIEHDEIYLRARFPSAFEPVAVGLTGGIGGFGGDVFGVVMAQ